MSVLQYKGVSPKLLYLFQGGYSGIKLSTEFSLAECISTSPACQLSPSIAHLFNLQLLLSQHSFTKNPPSLGLVIAVQAPLALGAQHM